MQTIMNNMYSMRLVIFNSFFQAIHYQPNRIIIHYSKAGICQLQLYEKIAMLMTANFALILMFQISFLSEARLACFWHTEKYRYALKSGQLLAITTGTLLLCYYFNTEQDKSCGNTQNTKEPYIFLSTQGPIGRAGPIELSYPRQLA